MRKEFILKLLTKRRVKIWREIKGLNGDYRVNNFGEVRSFKKDKKKGLKLSQHLRNGYLLVSLSINGKSKNFSVHRLVYESFIGDIIEGREIDHINTKRSDNRLCNLRMLTHLENCNTKKTKKNRKIGVIKTRNTKEMKAEEEWWRGMAQIRKYEIETYGYSNIVIDWVFPEGDEFYEEEEDE